MGQSRNRRVTIFSCMWINWGVFIRMGGGRKQLNMGKQRCLLIFLDVFDFFITMLFDKLKVYYCLAKADML